MEAVLGEASLFSVGMVIGQFAVIVLLYFLLLQYYQSLVHSLSTS